MNRFSFFLTLIFSFLFTFSCTDLEEDLIGEVTDDIVIPGVDIPTVTTTTSVPAQLASAYGQLRGAGTANHGSYYSVSEITTDEMVIGAKGGDWFDGGILIQLHQHSYDATHGFLNNAWNGQYAAINTCNELLQGGLDAWKKLNLPIETGEERPHDVVNSKYQCNVQPNYVIHAHEVLLNTLS